MEMRIFYNGIHIGKRRVDFFREENVVLEIMAVSELTDTYLSQALNYLEALNWKPSFF
jgi:GxxExxY protein